MRIGLQNQNIYKIIKIICFFLCVLQNMLYICSVIIKQLEIMIYKKVYTTDKNGNCVFENNEAKFTKRKLTANQYAKEELFSALETAFYFDESNDVSGMTENEIEKIKEQMDKRIQGIRKYLGL